MRAVNITDQTQVVAEAAITAEPGAEVDWPDDLTLPATFAAADDAEKAADEPPAHHRARRGRTTEENR